MNAIIEQYLQAFINYQQDNWTSWLPIAEFTSTYYASEKTGCSQFFSNYGLHLRINFSQHPVQNRNDIREVNANILSQKMNEVFEEMKTNMARAQSIPVEEADMRHWEQDELKPGDRV
jgi:hypothetical protein